MVGDGGLPITWQGWIVFAAYLLSLPLGYLWFPPHQKLIGFMVYTHAVTAVLVVICWLTGEPPRWRWGK
jgi:membrane-anchored protein YejM (alkaline phosphatase superfamily)